ncbi:RNA ligase/cyclic nucleotide phosphodiesterase [Rhexocercosporidium sp. MPI-PUGE-AT-0058]|nr:RNA ligase/cyclic nucleotide phosphodiesterase [Rhexocercosporidium sp. MPI-PUGE-AT-0058]
MAPQVLETADSRNKFEDLSGVDISAYANPYDALLEACNNDAVQLQTRYGTHRSTRNGQQKEKLLSPEFSGLILDPILQRVMDSSVEPGFIDPRNCLVFWARPPSHIRSLVDQVQQKLLSLAPKLWLMPVPNLHLTALELTHSLTEAQITAIIKDLGPEATEKITDYTYTHRPRLIKPMLSYDGAALALSFLPAAGEGLPSTSSDTSSRIKQDDDYTYHHLRRDLFNIASATGVTVDSRYVVPSSHITVGRFLTQEDHASPEKMVKFIELIEEINAWLEREYWPSGDERREAGEWIVGQERGLDFRMGRLWYGGGKTVRLGRGF